MPKEAGGVAAPAVPVATVLVDFAGGAARASGPVPADSVSARLAATKGRIAQACPVLRKSAPNVGRT